MKKILLLVHAPQKRPGHLNWLSFRDLIKSEVSEDVQVEMSALTQLTFVLDSDNTRVYDHAQKFDVSSFDLVVFRTIGAYLEEAIAVAAYCRKKGIRYIDTYLPKIGNDKLDCAFVRWEHNLPVPKTIYGPVDGMLNEVATVGLPAVLKASAGKKGRDNYLVSTEDEISQYMAASGAPAFVLQNFIPNDGDLRLVVLNDEVRLVIKRHASQGSHLNNTSQGGTAELIEPRELPESALALAKEAARLEQLTVAGVDLIEDSQTGAYYVLEVNRAPQIATGGFAELKAAAYAQMLETLVKENK